MSYGTRVMIKRSVWFVGLVVISTAATLTNAGFWVTVAVGTIWLIVAEVIFNTWVNEAKEK